MRKKRLTTKDRSKGIPVHQPGRVESFQTVNRNGNTLIDFFQRNQINHTKKLRMHHEILQ